MNVKARQTPGTSPSPEEFAEAAAWVARLHGPNRTLQAEQGFRRWLASKPAHSAAFEAMTAAWEMTGKLPQTPFPRLSRWQRAGYREGFIRSAIAVAGIAALALSVMFYAQRMGGIATHVGEQRTSTLEDGTRVTLNTATRIIVNYDEKLRVVELKNGEALFEVAKVPERPFVVRAGNRSITALGTSFVVRYDPNRTAVTLVDGKVNITPAADEKSVLMTSLAPGQRLTFSSSKPPKLDEPPIEKVIAWRRGLLDFESTRLSEAIEEMNRYSTIKLALESPQAASIPITGVFRAGDAPSFAAALTRAYPLQVVGTRKEIRLTVTPAFPNPARSSTQ